MAYKQHYTREKYETKRQEACIALSITFEQKYSCYKEAQSRKDYLPWWYVLLIWPDAITTWAILATVFVIAWQSNETRRAALTAIAQVELTKSKERPSLRIELRGVTLDLSDSPDIIPIDGSLTNTGGSPAYIVDSRFECWIGEKDSPPTPEVYAPNLHLPETIPPSYSDSIEQGVVVIDHAKDGGDRVMWFEDDPRIAAVLKGQLAIHLVVVIAYSNYFREDWELRLKRQFTVDSNVKGFTLGGWSKYGKPEDNSEREMPKLKQPL